MTRTTALSLAAVSLAGILLTSPASSQATTEQAAMCGVRTEIVTKLSKEFQEAPMATGMVDQSAVLEIFVSDTGTWTILATRPDGTSCVVSAGEGWDSKTMITGRDA
jgi:hypothetical protein